MVLLRKKFAVLAASAGMSGLAMPAYASPVAERQRHGGGLNAGAVLIGAAVIGGAFLLSRELRKSGRSSDVAERQSEMQRVDRARRQQVASNASGKCVSKAKWQAKGSLPTIASYADSNCDQRAHNITNVSFSGL